MSNNPNPPTGWLCPNCGMTWAPWVISCECGKDEGQVFEAVLEERPLPPCKTMMERCPHAQTDSPLWDVLTGQRCRCDRVWEGSQPLLACLKRLPIIDDEDSSSPLPKYVEALQELREGVSYTCVCGENAPAMIAPSLLHSSAYPEDNYYFLRCLTCHSWRLATKHAWDRQKAKWEVAMRGNKGKPDEDV